MDRPHVVAVAVVAIALALLVWEAPTRLTLGIDVAARANPNSVGAPAHMVGSYGGH